MNSKLDGIHDWDERARRARFKVIELAGLCKVTPRHLDRYILEKFGEPALHWITGVRFREAAALILQDRPIKEVADKAGYSTPAHFCRAFKRFYRLSPTAFRSTKAGQGLNVPFRQQMSGLGDQ
jgi:AraC-like DNA-binding protein